MPETLTFNLANSNGRTYTIMAESANLVKSAVTVKNNTITQSDVSILQRLAAKNGDAGILEQCDLNGEQKLNLAKLNDFSKYYDIQLSEDGKMFKVTVKATGIFTKNPTLGTIKADFGVKDNVFVQGHNIPYDNEGTIEKRAVPGSSADGRNTDYDAAKLLPGDSINIPVACVSISSSPRGAFERALYQ